MRASLRPRPIDDHRSLRLARATSALLGSRLAGGFFGRLDGLRTATALLHRSFDFVFNIGGHGLARTAPSLLRGRSLLDLGDFFDLLLLSRERLARTASSLLRSNFDFGVVFGVGDRGGLLRAAATFLRGGVFGGGGSSCGLLTLLGGGLFCLLVVFVGGLGLSGTATFLASGLLRLGFVVAVLDVVSGSKWWKILGKENKD